jgi:hypothetical protein
MPVVHIENCRDAFLTNCFALPGTDVFLKLSGQNTANISLKGNDLSKAKTPLHVGDNVSQGEIRD